MKNFILLTVILLFVLVTEGCEPKSESGLDCNSIVLNKPFTARVGEEWCIPETGWKINFGSYIQDSRCNVVDIECVWEGMFVMATTIENGEIVQDTFVAVHNWQDTLYSGPYIIVLNKIKPEIRTTPETLDPSAYSFDMLVR